MQELLHFHTENPPGNEAPAAEYLAGYLGRLGFQTRCYESEPGRASLVARLPGRGGGRSLALNGHLDIGPIGNGWTRDPWGGEVADGKIYGRGAGDMKSGLAFFVFAMRALRDLDIPVARRVVLQLNADEEVGSPASRALTESSRREQYCSRAR